MNAEVRTFELRAAANEDFVLEGTAVSYDCLSQDLGGFRERILPGSFSRSLKSGADVKCLLNHDPNHVLGRVQSGTLKLHDETNGLHFHVQLDRNNSAHQNVYAMVKRGDLNECSFAFVVPKGGDNFEEDEYQGKKIVRRTVHDADLRDVSVVTYPAYNAKGATSVDARTTHVGTRILSQVQSPSSHTRQLLATPAAIDAWNRRRCEEIGREIAASDDAEIAANSKRRTPAEIDEYNRRRAEEIALVVAEDHRRGDIS